MYSSVCRQDLATKKLAQQILSKITRTPSHCVLTGTLSNLHWLFKPNFIQCQVGLHIKGESPKAQPSQLYALTMSQKHG